MMSASTGAAGGEEAQAESLPERDFRKWKLDWELW
jgi:hypothetical protein